MFLQALISSPEIRTLKPPAVLERANYGLAFKYNPADEPLKHFCIRSNWTTDEVIRYIKEFFPEPFQWLDINMPPGQARDFPIVILARRHTTLRISRQGAAHSGQDLIDVVKEVNSPNAAARKLYLGEKEEDPIENS